MIIEKHSSNLQPVLCVSKFLASMAFVVLTRIVLRQPFCQDVKMKLLGAHSCGWTVDLFRINISHKSIASRGSW